jgi:hypothetical protein
MIFLSDEGGADCPIETPRQFHFESEPAFEDKGRAVAIVHPGSLKGKAR